MPEPEFLRSARPTVLLDGAENVQLRERLLSLLIVENTAGLYRCEASVGNWGDRDGSLGYLFADRRALDFGKSLRIKVGPDTLFDGRVTGLEAQFPDHLPPVINVLAEDRFQDLRMTRRTRAFSDVSDADIFSRVANDHGLTASVNVQGPTYRVLSQVNQSDLAFLRERARLVDAELWMDGSTLNARSHAARGGAPLKLTYGGSLQEFSVLADLAHQRTTVKVSGWDVSSKAAIDESAGESAVSAELDGKRSGSSVLGQALAERNERVAASVPLSSDEARAMAEARYRERARRFVRGRGWAEGTPAVRVGGSLALKQVGDLFEGKYYVTLARHTFDLAKGYQTSFEVERPGVGG